MFNAYLKKSACAPKIVEFNSIPDRTERTALRENFEEIGLPLLRTLQPDVATLAYAREEGTRSGNPKLNPGFVDAYVGTMDASTFIDLLKAMRWYDESAYKANVVRPRIAYLEDLLGRGKHSSASNSDFNDVAVIVPHPKRVRKPRPHSITVPGLDFPIPLLKRSRRENRHDVTGTDRKYAYVVENIAAGNDCTDLAPADRDRLPLLKRLHFDSKRGNISEPFDTAPDQIDSRGAVLVTFFDDRPQPADGSEWETPPDFRKGEVGMTLAFNSPHAPAKGLDSVLEWGVVIKSEKGDDPITIPADSK